MKNKKIHLFPQKEDYLNKIEECQQAIIDTDEMIKQLEESYNSIFFSRKRKEWYRPKIEYFKELKERRTQDLLYYQKKYNQCLEDEKKSKNPN